VKLTPNNIPKEKKTSNSNYWFIGN